jgi:L-alanine-DL-glutamate epimerase-like enolase superfamily enzyme
MKPSDVRIEAVEVTFSNEQLAVPLRLSKGTIREITYVQVTITLVTRQGQQATGKGAILLSDLWAFPHPTLDHAAKDGAMRAICTTLAQQLPLFDHFSDPLQKHEWLEHLLAQAVTKVESEQGWAKGTLPQLAALNALSPFDAAIHDGWGIAIGQLVYQLYTAEWLNADLGIYFSGALAGRYPGDYLVPRRPHLRIQHVVGVGDALTPDAAPARVLPNLPADLTSWVQRDLLSSFKIKTKGQDPLLDAQRVAAIYATVAATQPSERIRLSVDPNEGCPDAAFLLQMLDALARDAPEAFDALDCIEQPTGRDLAAYTFTLHEVAARKPVILDESFDSLTVLPQMAAQGWSGLAIKTGKGQSSSLLAYCWAKHHGYYVTLQDLTNPGHALVHSANLCAHLDLATDSFECNSRQYMPCAR